MFTILKNNFTFLTNFSFYITIGLFIHMLSGTHCIYINIYEIQVQYSVFKIKRYICMDEWLLGKFSHFLSN